MAGPGPYLAIYGVIALSHLVIQTLLAHLEARRQRREAAAPAYGTHAPSVSVVIPVFNEDPATLRRCLESLRDQDYPVLDVVVVDDGSTTQEELRPVYDELIGGRLRLWSCSRNQGKREAQRIAFDLAWGEVVVTVDSDTVLHDANAIRLLVQRLADEEVGAVTGNVAVDNRGDNLLTRLIGYRYWNAFNQERAAQSLFHVVICCSGPFAAYRRSVIDKVKDRYFSQTFLGERCTYGDDRHLTNLVLGEGYRVCFDARAEAHTAAPTQIGMFLRQQIRWNKSFFRELRWTLPFAHRCHPYLIYDLACQTLLPVLLVTTATLTVLQTAAQGAGVGLHYFLTVMVVGLVRSLYGGARTRDPGFASFALYGLVHILLLKPVSLYALATLGTNHWGTRDTSLDTAPDELPAQHPVERPAYDVAPELAAVG
jgi:hyaluronan synthase/N-acetylglucosaminyltransferase